jgi:protein gp37
MAQASGKRENVFTCSWSDFFHSAADAWRPEAWEIIRACDWLNFQILTKRIERVRECLPSDWGERGYPNVWLGVSVENKRFLWRVNQLREIPAQVHFVSGEPLLEDISDDLDLTGIEWFIVGGESGPNFRPMPHDWARRLRDKCHAHIPRVAFFFKQSAARWTEMGTTLDGRPWREYPENGMDGP